MSEECATSICRVTEFVSGKCFRMNQIYLRCRLRQIFPKHSNTLVTTTQKASLERQQPWKLVNVVGSSYYLPQSPLHFAFRASVANAYGPQSCDCSLAGEYWRLRYSDCRHTLTYAHTPSHTLPTCDINLGSRTYLRLKVETLWNKSYYAFLTTCL